MSASSKFIHYLLTLLNFNPKNASAILRCLQTILLLIAISKNNANIQKIIAFENGFDRILVIIKDEGYSDGGPVVEDCLHLFLNLLRNNNSNLTFFREGKKIFEVRILSVYSIDQQIILFLPCRELYQ